MERTITTLLAVLICWQLPGQGLEASGFRSAPNDFSAASTHTRRLDFEGNTCALVKISTKVSGLSFDAGMSCIADIVYAEPGIWLYIPARTRNITISHKEYGTLRQWYFPVTLEPGRTYEMSLKADKPKASAYKPRKEFLTEGFSDHFLQSIIGMSVCEGGIYGAAVGVNYSYMPGRWGFYTAVEFNDACGMGLFAGPAVRMYDSRSSTDWQLYAGIGYVGGNSVGVDLGTKFGWKSDKVLSRWDFSIGCQYWGDGMVVPYIGLGAGITGYTAMGILAIFAGILGLAL